MPRIPAITGIGLVSALGNSAPATWDALLAGRYIDDHSKVPLEFSGDSPSRVSGLAIRAAREAIETIGADNRAEAALVVGTSKGPVENWLRPLSMLWDVDGLVCRRGIASVAADVAAATGLNGPRITISAACASGLHALIRGAMMIQSGEARRALVVAAEASVHPLFVSSFGRLGVLAHPSIGCRPFDQERCGFLMSEAAAAVMLEMVDEREGAGRIAIERFALAADATHLVRGEAGAPTLRRVLETVVADGAPVDLFHAHGTGTILNDTEELEAIEQVAARPNPSRPALYSHKGALGHSLGAAGLVSIVINVMCHHKGVVPPNVRTQQPVRTDRLQLSASALKRRVRRSVALAAGFGGPIAGVTLFSGSAAAGA